MQNSHLRRLTFHYRCFGRDRRGGGFLCWRLSCWRLSWNRLSHLNPFLGLHAAVTRRRPDGSPAADGWYPRQRLDLLRALHGYTTGPAFAAGLEESLGKLAPGYHADLIVLDEDPFSLPAEELHRLHPTATMVGGEWVWQAA